jgi:hypothetical protein
MCEASTSPGGPGQTVETYETTTDRIETEVERQAAQGHPDSCHAAIMPGSKPSISCIQRSIATLAKWTEADFGGTHIPWSQLVWTIMGKPYHICL